MPMISSPCIADIDSIASFLRQAEQKVKILDYTEASEFYLKALLLNPNDKAVQARRLDVENMYTMDCNRYSGIAESYFNDGDYEKAVELYEKVVEMNCFNSELAARRIGVLQAKISSRQQRASVWTFEYGFKQALSVFLSVDIRISERAGIGAYRSIRMSSRRYRKIMRWLILR